MLAFEDSLGVWGTFIILSRGRGLFIGAVRSLADLLGEVVLGRDVRLGIRWLGAVGGRLLALFDRTPPLDRLDYLDQIVCILGDAVDVSHRHLVEVEQATHPVVLLCRQLYVGRWGQNLLGLVRLRALYWLVSQDLHILVRHAILLRLTVW